MSQNIKQKLELTWIGKGQEPKLEPRILIENPEYSYGDQQTENILIHGDNLLALKALEQDYAGKIKCIYIDPPYNTGNAFEHYDDGLEHSLWLSLLNNRLKILKNLLSDNGLIFIQLDDNEIAYCRVIMDEIYGRQNFINQVSVKMKQTAGASGGGEDKKLKKNIEYILIYTKDITKFSSFNIVNDEVDLFELISEMKDSGKSWKYTRIIHGIEEREFLTETIDGAGEKIKIYKHHNIKYETITDVMRRDGLSEEECYFKYFDKIFRDTNAQSSIRTRVIESTNGLGDFFSIDYIPRSGKNKNTLSTIYYKGNNRDQIAWLSDICKIRGNRIIKLERPGTFWDGFPLNNLTKEGNVLFPNGKKPELLIKKIIELSTNETDIILDSFLGSGTTAAVAHKMGRRWIGIELGEHAKTHCYPRLKQVVDGEQGGISKAVNWQGGGGFKFYELAPPLLSEDNFGNMVISPVYNPQMLAAAMAKHEGFKYLPDPEKYWKQGISSEKDFIFTTTQYITRTILDSVAEGLLNDESLLICCTQFEAGIENSYSNINIRKIPSMLLNRCEFKQDSDYSFNIINSPLDELRPETGERKQAVSATKEKPKHTTENPDLFSQQPND